MSLDLGALVLGALCRGSPNEINAAIKINSPEINRQATMPAWADSNLTLPLIRKHTIVGNGRITIDS